jgi:hypothetical protein
LAFVIVLSFFVAHDSVHPSQLVSRLDGALVNRKLGYCIPQIRTEASELGQHPEG